jgi:hypothetical protein
MHVNQLFVLKNAENVTYLLFTLLLEFLFRFRDYSWNHKIIVVI